MSKVEVSDQDITHLKIIRNNVNSFLKYVANKFATKPGRLLDIAPQIHDGARPFFSDKIIVNTLDIDPNSGCTYIGDICKENHDIPDDFFEYIVCTEVLEHTLQPFNAISEMRRILVPGGLLFISVPFNFRIHGPLPDCWRFTEYGLKALLKDFEILELNQINTKNRDLMPIHYTIVASKTKIL